MSAGGPPARRRLPLWPFRTARGARGAARIGAAVAAYVILGGLSSLWSGTGLLVHLGSSPRLAALVLLPLLASFLFSIVAGVAGWASWTGQPRWAAASLVGVTVAAVAIQAVEFAMIGSLAYALSARYLLPPLIALALALWALWGACALVRLRRRDAAPATEAFA